MNALTFARLQEAQARSGHSIAKIPGVLVREIHGEPANGKTVAHDAPRLHKNKRAAKVQVLYEKLSTDEQRVVMKQIKLMAGQGR